MAVNPAKPVSVFIADDHTLYVDALVFALENQRTFPVHIIGRATNGEELLNALHAIRPDIILLDLNMPVINGIEALPQIRSAYPKIKIVIVTKYSDPKFVKECLQVQHVAGYILKTSSFQELLTGLTQIQSGQLYTSRSLKLFPKESEEHIEPGMFDEAFLAKYNLTRRELEILSLIAQAKNNAEIADSLFISPQTVGAHRKNIMRKLNITSTAGLVRFAIENQLG